MRLLWFSTSPPSPRRPPRLGFLAAILAAYRLALWVRCYGDRSREPRPPQAPGQRSPDSAPIYTPWSRR